MTQVQASDEAFAAILSDVSVVSWGQFRSVGDSTAVQTASRRKGAARYTHCLCSASGGWLCRAVQCKVR